MTGKKIDNVTNIVDAMIKRGRKPPEPVKPPKPTKSLAIRGDNNVGVVGHGNHITINSRSRRRSPQPPPSDPGGQHITHAQAGILFNMVQDLYSLGVPPARVWSRLKKDFQVAGYHYLPLTEFQAAEAYLRKKLAIQRTKRPSGQFPRNNLLAAIHATAKQKRLQSLDPILSRLTPGKSLSKLTIAELQSVLDAVQAAS